MNLSQKGGGNRVYCKASQKRHRKRGEQKGKKKPDEHVKEGRTTKRLLCDLIRCNCEAKSYKSRQQAGMGDKGTSLRVRGWAKSGAQKYLGKYTISEKRSCRGE